MAANKGNYLEQQLLQHIFGSTTYAKPGATAAALGTGTTADAFTEADNGANKYDNYARVAVTQGSGWTIDGTGGTWTVVNAAAVTFAAGITGDTELLKEMAIWDSATYAAGNMLYRGALTANLQMGLNVVPEFAAGAFTLEEQ